MPAPKAGSLGSIDSFILSSFYAFWSRTFEIESTALPMKIYLLTASLRSLEAGKNLAIVFFLFGVEAVAIKVTTFLIYVP